MPIVADPNLDYLPVDVATTVDGKTTIALRFYPHAKTVCGVPPSGLDLYNADTLSASKLVDVVLPANKAWEDIVCSAAAVVTELLAWDYGDGGLSMYATAVAGLSLRLRLTELGVSNPIIQIKIMNSQAGGYSNPPAFVGSKPYSTLHTGLRTNNYKAEVLADDNTVLRSIASFPINVPTAPVTPPVTPPPAGNDTVYENRTSGTAATPENITDMDGTAAINTPAPN